MTKQDLRIGVLTDTVLHYRLANQERREPFKQWLAERKLVACDCAVTICELIAKLNKDRQLVIGGLKFSKEECGKCLPNPDSYVSYWVESLTTKNIPKIVRFDLVRDEILQGASQERENEIVKGCNDILDKANQFVADIGNEVKQMETTLYEAFPDLKQIYPNGMRQKEVESAFSKIIDNENLQSILAEQLLKWFGITESQITNLSKKSQLIKIGKVLLLTKYYLLLWRDYLHGANRAPNDREDFLLLTYAPATRYFLTGDKKFAKRFAEAASGTSFEDWLYYVEDNKESFEPILSTKLKDKFK